MLDEDTVLEDVMELGGDDMTYSEESIEIVCDPTAVGALREGLTAKGYLVASAEAEEVPSTYVTLTEEESLCCSSTSRMKMTSRTFGPTGICLRKNNYLILQSRGIARILRLFCLFLQYHMLLK